MIDIIASCFSVIPASLKAVGLAVITAYVRISCDHKMQSTARKLTESVFCGLIALAVFYGIRAMGLNEDWAPFAGGFIGCMGSNFVRDLSRIWVATRIKQGAQNDETH